MTYLVVQGGVLGGWGDANNCHSRLDLESHAEIGMG